MQCGGSKLHREVQPICVKDTLPVVESEAVHLYQDERARGARGEGRCREIGPPLVEAVAALVLDTRAERIGLVLQ